MDCHALLHLSSSTRTQSLFSDKLLFQQGKSLPSPTWIPPWHSSLHFHAFCIDPISLFQKEKKQSYFPESRLEQGSCYTLHPLRQQFPLQRAVTWILFVQFSSTPHSLAFLFDSDTINTVFVGPTSPYRNKTEWNNSRNLYSKQRCLVTVAVLL